MTPRVPHSNADVLWRSDSMSLAWFQHRVVKYTPARITIESNHFDGTRYESHTVTIDRRALGRDGFVWSSVLQRRVYTASAKAEEIAARAALVEGATESEVAPFGIVWPAGADDIKRLFRAQVLVHHPDKGGSAEDFIALDRSYKSALARAGTNARTYSEEELLAFGETVRAASRKEEAARANYVEAQANRELGVWVAATRTLVVALRAEAWARAGICIFE